MQKVLVDRRQLFAQSLVQLVNTFGFPFMRRESQEKAKQCNGKQRANALLAQAFQGAGAAAAINSGTTGV